MPGWTASTVIPVKQQEAHIRDKLPFQLSESLFQLWWPGVGKSIEPSQEAGVMRLLHHKNATP